MKMKKFMGIMLSVLLILGNGVLPVSTFGAPEPVETVEIESVGCLDLKNLVGLEEPISLSYPVPVDMDLGGYKRTILAEKENKVLLVINHDGSLEEYLEIPNAVFISNPVISTKYGFFEPQQFVISTLESDEINPNMQRAVIYRFMSDPVILDQKDYQDYRFISDPAMADIDGNGYPEIIVVTGCVMDDDGILDDGTIKDEAIIGFNATVIKDDLQEHYEIDLTEVQYGEIKNKTPIISPQLSISTAIDPDIKVKVEYEEEGLVGYWKMDEESGTRYDSSDNNNNLLDVNSVGYSTGHDGNAADFVPNGQYLYMPSGLYITGDMTVACWINLKSMNNNAANDIIARYPEGNGSLTDYIFYIEGGNNKLKLWDGSVAVESNDSVPVGSWHHVGFVKKWNEENEEYDITFYIDGVIDGDPDDEPLILPTGTTVEDAGVFIGTHCPESHADMKLDELGVLDRALQPEEIIDAMNSGFTGYSYEEYSATGAIVGVTLFGTELYAFSFADINSDGYPEGGGVVKGFPVSDGTVAIGQSTFTPDGNLVVNTINDEGIPATRVYLPEDNGSYSEYEWQVSQSAVKCGNISLFDFDNNGIPLIISPFQFSDTVEAKVFNPEDLSVPVASVTWDSPNFSPDYFEVFPMQLLVNGEPVPVTFYLLGNVGYTADNQYEVIFEMPVGETVIGREIADINGGGKPQMAVVTDSGCIYPYELGVNAPPTPLRTYPMSGWVPPSEEENHEPGIIDLYIENDTVPIVMDDAVPVVEEKLIARFMGIDADPCDILHYSATDNAGGECKVEFKEDMWELWYKPSTAGPKTLTLEVSDIFTTGSCDIGVFVYVALPPDPPLNPSITISGPLVTETPLGEKFTKYKYAWIRLHPSAEGENMQMKIGVDPSFTQSYTVHEYGQGWVDVAPHWEDFKELKFVKLPELNEDGVKTFYVKFRQKIDGLVSEETAPVVWDSITLDTKAPELSALVVNWFQSADVMVDGITTYVDTHSSMIQIWGEFSDENLKTPAEDSLEIIGGLPGMSPPENIEYTYYDEWEEFWVYVTLKGGQNGFKLVASDKAGNQTERRFEVNRSILPDLVIEKAVCIQGALYNLLCVKVRNQGGGDMQEGQEVPVVAYGYKDDSFWWYESDTLLYTLPYEDSAATKPVKDIPAGGYQWVYFLVTWEDCYETDYWKFKVDPDNELEEAYIYDDPDNITGPFSFFLKNNNGYYLEKEKPQLRPR